MTEKARDRSGRSTGQDQVQPGEVRHIDPNDLSSGERERLLKIANTPGRYRRYADGPSLNFRRRGG